MSVKLTAAALLEDEEIDPKAFVMAQPVEWVIIMPTEQVTLFWHVSCLAGNFRSGNWTANKAEAAVYKSRIEAKVDAVRFGIYAGDAKIVPKLSDRNWARFRKPE